MEQSAVAYFPNERLIIAPVVRTTAGLGLEVDPLTLTGAPTEAEVAGILAQALARSARAVPHPAQDEWRGAFKPFQAAAGVRSFKAFMQDARQVSIEAVDDRLTLTPHRNLGSKEGFEPIAEQAIYLPRYDTNGAAAALLGLLGLREAQ